MRLRQSHQPGHVLVHPRHVAQVFPHLPAQQAFGIDLGNIERRQLVCLLARRRAFEDENFILADVSGGFADFLVPVHSATSFAAASIEALVVVSVQHHSAALPSSGYNFFSGKPPMMRCPSSLSLMVYGSVFVWTTNSLKRGAPSNSSVAPSFLNCSAA